MKSVEKLKSLQKKIHGIRNICILAHVDHGKTTLADALVASNGIISQRMAGKLRYMDSREDEQVRGITMKSSAVSLSYKQDEEEYLINLIDSPGHIDFSSEVSTAVRLCDGAIVLVDVVEGVCPQTHAVLRQAWLENIKPVLMFNKIDRLIVELKMSPLEAHTHLLQLLEKVNAISGELFNRGVFATYSEDTTSTPDEKAAGQNTNNEAVYDWDDEEDELFLYFCPDQGNVVFGSAIDGWGFRISQFAELFARKIGVSAAVLNKTLWGDFYLDVKTKTIRKGAQKKGKKPLFVQLVLENLWAFYDVITVSKDKEKIEKMMKSLDLKPVPRCNDPKAHLQALFNQWLPLSQTVLAMVCEKLPSPVSISEERIEKLLCSTSHRFSSLPQSTQQLKHDFMASSSADSAPVVVFVSKMFSVDAASLPQNRPRALTVEEMAERRQAVLEKRLQQQSDIDSASNIKDSSGTTIELAVSKKPDGSCTQTCNGGDNTNRSGEVFIAFARIFSGTVRKNQKIFVLNPKYDPTKASDIVKSAEELTDRTNGSINEEMFRRINHVTEVTVNDLYLLMGRELVDVEEVPAGNVLGIGGLGDFIFKSATLSSTLSCPSFTDMYQEAAPIVRVAVEPTNAGDLKTLINGLRLLNQSDPCVEVSVEETGEYIIVGAGEVHLQKCLDDLRDKFAKIQIRVSAPTVPFRETIILPPTVDMVNETIQDSNQQPNPPRNRNTGKQAANRDDQDQEQEENEEEQERGVAQGFTTSRNCLVQIRAVPLPTEVIRLLGEHVTLVRSLEKLSSEYKKQGKEASGENEANKVKEASKNITSRVSEEMKKSTEQLKVKLENAFMESDPELWSDVVDKIWSFGPKRNCTNILVNRIPGYNRPSLWSCVNDKSEKENLASELKEEKLKANEISSLSQDIIANQKLDELKDDSLETDETYKLLRSYETSIVTGFQLATQAGPLCEEPMTGVCFILEQFQRTSEQQMGKQSKQTVENSADGQENKLNDDIIEKKPNNHSEKKLNESPSTDSQTNEAVNANLRRESTNESDCSASEKIKDNAQVDSESVRDVCPEVESASLHHSAGPAALFDNNAALCDDENELSHIVKQDKTSYPVGQFSGQLISCVKETCRRAFQTQPQRLVWAMYSCVIFTTAEALGKMYGVLGKRNGRVLQEDVRDGWSVFSIDAVLPVVESFGFADEIRKKTSGLASPQLRFSHWEPIDIDPHWVPTTEEEYLHYGEKADAENIARRHMNAIRRRKGLKVKEKIVEFAEKQRTLKKNK